MQSKDQILEQSHRLQLNAPNRAKVAALHEQLIIEVLIDIRDLLHSDLGELIEDLNTIANKD